MFSLSLAFSISSSGNVGYQEASCARLTSTSCTVDKLTPATTYYFKVQAVNAQGDKGPLSDFAVATTNTTSKLFCGCRKYTYPHYGR